MTAAGHIDATKGDLPSLSLYLHFPWCVQKCPYCDFNSHQLKDALPEQRYIEAMVADLSVQATRVAGRSVQSVFMGGGTPSLFSPEALARLLGAVRQQLDLAPGAEITMEANPATVERGRFAEYHQIGINRVSLGAQSFNSDTLKALGRIHKPADVLRAADELHACGLVNFNLDLMYALPHQSLACALADVTSALSLEPSHLSHYQLTLEPGTVFAAQPPPLPDDDLAWSMQTECQGLLAARGFEQYEVSAYAKRGRQCAHNLNYWQHGDYLGVGAGAHGKLTGSTGAGEAVCAQRSTHLREPRRYLANAALGPEWRHVPADDQPFEFMMNALRLNAGFPLALFVARTGLPAQAVLPKLQELAGKGLMQCANDRWQATSRGRTYLNEVIQCFLPERNSQAGAGS